MGLRLQVWQHPGLRGSLVVLLILFFALLGIGLVSGFFALRSVGMTLASEGVVSAALASGTLIAIFAVAGAIHLRFVER